MKVSHHGSADQYQELLEFLHPDVALISVGKNNGYGHPTKRTLSVLERSGSVICRTDLLGAIAISRANSRFAIADSGAS
jgi:competence protein ComEC